MDKLRVANITTHASQTITINFDDGMGWIVATFCEDRGSVQINSDWGAVAFVWLPANTGFKGPHALKRFFAAAGDDYMINKFGYNQNLLKDVIDAKQTYANVFEGIIERRRDGSWDKDQAREVYDDLVLYADELNETDGVLDMNEQGGRWYSAMSEYFDEVYECISTRHSPMYVSYRDIVIPTIKQWIVDQDHGNEDKIPG